MNLNGETWDQTSLNRYWMNSFIVARVRVIKWLKPSFVLTHSSVARVLFQWLFSPCGNHLPWVLKKATGIEELMPSKCSGKREPYMLWDGMRPRDRHISPKPRLVPDSCKTLHSSRCHAKLGCRPTFLQKMKNRNLWLVPSNLVRKEQLKDAVHRLDR